ncbi:MULTISPECIES: TRAP transporter substrate-binding protein [Rhodomicrobium]|uniref:TRAP transporter substrate-binding protein n=1 Tax=Rhodomicrobium TaxID=1068 RepID=UPI000B4A5770|nr:MULTISPECIES: TRAP transporter substrate-binding protein [Rhodomicrobium]
MHRRALLKTAAASLAAGALAAPAIAQTSPEIRWRLTSSFPKSLDVTYGGAEVFSKMVAELTDNRFNIRVFAAGELVPGLQALDAVSNGTVEMAHSVSYYYVGKDPTFAIASSVPFGLNARQQNAWLFQGGGNEAFNEFYAKYHVYGLPMGNTGAQMGGWYRKEIKSVADLSGLKLRVGGIAGQVMAKLGIVPQQLAGPDVYPALERGTIDGVEWVGPYDDEKLGFVKVAPYYYYPGWWEGGSSLHGFINLEKWSGLPKSYQSAVVAAATYANTWMQARYDAKSPPALKRLISEGAKLRPFPADVMDAAYKASQELYTEISATNADFKAMIERMTAFRDEQYAWWQVAEYGYDSDMIQRLGRAAK